MGNNYTKTLTGSLRTHGGIAKTCFLGIYFYNTADNFNTAWALGCGDGYLRTGSHNQGDIQARFEVRVTPAPDFVVYDASGTLRAMLECKGANDGGTARDKALRFQRLREESVRLGGVPLLAVLGGIGWARVNDTLGPVVRDTDGRVFTLETLDQMLSVQPFPQLLGLTD